MNYIHKCVCMCMCTYVYMVMHMYIGSLKGDVFLTLFSIIHIKQWQGKQYQCPWIIKEEMRANR